MKMRVLYLNSANLDVEVWDEHELDKDGWAGYWEAMQYGCLDDIDINYNDIDRKVYVVSDGGEFFKLNDGRWMNICWRGASCHIWEEHDSDTLETIKEILG